MKHKTHHSSAPTWIVDYSAARARAIRWLGDRYLLAKPINATDSSRRSTAAVETHSQVAE